jgi:uncharacterized protein YjdB
VACGVGQEARLVATLADGPRGASFEFVASDDRVRVTAVAGGTATLVCRAAGRATVTVSSAGRSATVAVTATPAPGAVLGLDVEPASLTLVTAATWRLAARVRTRDARVSDAARFASLDTAVATVDSVTGVVRATAPGVTSLVVRSAADPSVRATVPVTVGRATAAVSVLIVEPPFVRLVVGDTARVTARVGLAPGAPPGTSRDVTWGTNDTTVVFVRADGLVQGRRPGAALVTARPVAAPAVLGVTPVTVREPPPDR